MQRPTTKTVLILGAGASWGYGFPTSFDLREKILSEAFQEPLRRAVGHRGDVAEFRHTFNFAEAQSIDRFLNYRPEFRPVGKVAIALALTLYEAESVNRGSAKPLQGGWYRSFLHYLTIGPPEYVDSRFSIITFNYDRTWEMYLWRSLQNLFGLSDDEAAKQASKINVIHVYGSLGRLPEYAGMPSSESGPDVPYGTTELGLVRAAADKIDLQWATGRSCEATSQRILETLKTAERTCCLGFGFDDENVERLRHGIQHTTGPIDASALRINQGIRTRVNNAWLGRTINWGHDAEDINAFLYACDVLMN